MNVPAMETTATPTNSQRYASKMLPTPTADTPRPTAIRGSQQQIDDKAATITCSSCSGTAPVQFA
jgi:hypothetical protein